MEREELVNVKLRAAREKAKLTQAQVAQKAEVAERMYQYYEADKKEPRARTANRIARAVGSTSEEIWGFGAATPID